MGSVAAIKWITSSMVHSLGGVLGICGLMEAFCWPVTVQTGVEGIPERNWQLNVVLIYSLTPIPLFYTVLVLNPPVDEDGTFDSPIVVSRS